MRHTTRISAGPGLSILAALLLLLGLPVRPAEAQEKPTEGAKIAAALSREYRHVAAKLRPSVVSIESTKIFKPGGMAMPQSGEPGMPGMTDPGNDLLRRFFGLQGGQMGRQPMKQVGLGTGVVVSADGDILTNNHVVKDADQVRVQLSDGRELTAKVVGTDPETDLAVIHVSAKDLTPADLGNSDQVEPGDLVVAIGSPFGLKETMTSGIVSAMGRARVGIADYEDFIQTDAAINPGNSGGPLANLNGQVIGINTAIFSRGGGNNGIGFSIPINMAKDVMQEILATGHVTRGYLGVQIQDLNPGLAKSFSYDGKAGALVAQVMPGTPAAKAGLQEGDIITAVNGSGIADTLALRNLVAGLNPGAKTDLTVFRNGQSMTVPVTIGRQGAESGAASSTAEKSKWDELGLSVAPLTSAAARRFGDESAETGVLVTGVEPGGIADDAGLMAGDVIVSVAGRDVKDEAAFRAELEKSDLAAGVRLQVVRKSEKIYVFLQRESE